MKHCPHCNSEMEDNFELCWNCNYSLTEGRIVDIMDEKQLNKKQLECLRCKTPMHFSGNYKFHEGTNLGVFGNLFEFFINKEAFDIYVCPRCGKVEFYVPDTSLDSFRS